MKNAELMKQRLEKVKKENSYTKALSALADIQYEIGLDACQERNNLRRDVNSLREVILGNGSPEKAMLTRLAKVETFVTDIDGKIDKMDNALYGDEKDPGMLENIRKLKESNDKRERLTWLVISIVVGEIVLSLLGIL